MSLPHLQPVLKNSTPPVNSVHSSGTEIEFSEFNYDPSMLRELSVGSVNNAAREDQAVQHPRQGWMAWRWPAVLLLLCLNMLMYGYDVSNIANVQSQISKAFGQTQLLPWVAAGSTCMIAVFALMARKLCVLVDMRYQVLAYLLILLIGAIVSGSAQRMVTMIIGRCITGIGAAGIYQTSMILNNLVTTPEEAPRTLALAAVFWAIGIFLGPLVGGEFADNEHATWRWAFYINFPILGLQILVSYLVLPSIKLDSNKSLISKLFDIDWIGFVLHSTSIIMTCSCLIFSGSTWTWSSASTIAAWVITGLIWVTYIRQQNFTYSTTARRRYFPLDLLGNREVVLVAFATMASAIAYSVRLFYGPLLFAFGRDDNPAQSGVHLLSFTGTFIFATLATGAAMPKVRVYAPFYILGGALILVGGALQTTTTPSTSSGRIMGCDAVIGVGVGLTFTTATGILTRMVPSDRAFDSLAMLVTFQLGGVLLSQTLAGSIYENVGFQLLQNAIGDMGFNADSIQRALAGTDSTDFAALSPEVAEAAVQAVTEILSRLNYIVVAAGTLTFIFGSQMGFEKLDFSHMRDESAAA